MSSYYYQTDGYNGDDGGKVDRSGILIDVQDLKSFDDFLICIDKYECIEGHEDHSDEADCSYISCWDEVYNIILYKIEKDMLLKIVSKHSKAINKQVKIVTDSSKNTSDAWTKYYSLLKERDTEIRKNSEKFKYQN